MPQASLPPVGGERERFAAHVPAVVGGGAGLVAPPSAFGELVADRVKDDLAANVQQRRGGGGVGQENETLAGLVACRVDELPWKLVMHPALFKREAISTCRRERRGRVSLRSRLRSVGGDDRALPGARK